MINESLELLERMNRLGLGGPGGDEYIKEDNDEEVLRGIIRKVRYSARDSRLKFTYMGKVDYISIPSNLSNRREIFEFIDNLFKKLNKAIHPIKLEAESTMAYKPEKEEKKEKAEKKEEEEK